MTRPPFSHLESAYQLHFYLCLKTHYLRRVFDRDDAQEVVTRVVDDVCGREDYHLLERQISPDHLRLLLSLKPDHTVSRAVKMLKGNISRQFSLALPGRLGELHLTTLWAEGYLATTSGKVDMQKVRNYIDLQVAHHGYRGAWTDGLKFVNPDFKSPAFHFKHWQSILKYHVVLATEFRRPVFDDTIASRLFPYVLAIGRKRGFQLERMTVLPDHIHLLLEALPSVSIRDLALSLVNNIQQWMEKHYSGVLKETGAWNLWQPSFYAGSVGEYTTAQVKRFLDNQIVV